MATRKPKISVIMPVYNAEKYLPQAIESILNQTYQDFEFLIFDDASTDNSRTVIQAYSDPKIMLITSDINQGYLVYLNQGIDLAQGEYIARMDADDISEPTRFAKQVQVLDENTDIGICGTWFSIFDNNGIVNTIQHPQYHNEIVESLFYYCPLGHPTIMGRRELFVENKYDKNFYPAEDYEIWSRLAQKTKLHNIQESLLNYRWHDTNISITKAAPQKKNTLAIQSELWQKRFPDLSDRDLQLLLEAFLLIETNGCGAKMSEITELVSRTVFARGERKGKFHELGKKRLQQYVEARMSKSGNYQIIKFAFSSIGLNLLNKDLAKKIGKILVKNIIKYK